MSLTIGDWQIGQDGASRKEKFSRIQQEHPSVLHIQM